MTMNRLDPSIESDCKAWHYREAHRLAQLRSAAAEVAMMHETGSPEWAAAVDDFIRAERALLNHYQDAPRC